MKKLGFLSFALYGALTLSASAADNLFEVTPVIGGSYHIQNDRYKNNADLVYGLKFANRVASQALVEFGYEYSKIKYTSNIKSDQNRYYINAIKEFDTSSNISPYILGGFGYEDFSKNLFSMDDDIFVQYGIGARWEATENIHLKTEIRHMISFDGRNDIVALAGIVIPFGKYKEEEQVLIEKTEQAVTQKKIVEESKPTLSHIHTFKVQFPFDSSDISPRYYNEIRDFAKYMKQNPEKTATISGHTDGIGSNEYNTALSERRAISVRDRIVNEGIDSSRLKVKGYGKTKPIADNSTAEGRRENRRVEAEVYIAK